MSLYYFLHHTRVLNIELLLIAIILLLFLFNIINVIFTDLGSKCGQLCFCEILSHTSS